MRAVFTRSASVGGTVFALSLSAAPWPNVTEPALAVLLQDQTLAEFIGSRDKVSGSVYIALLLVFGIMPRLRLSNQG
jgi:hypothetical protein